MTKKSNNKYGAAGKRGIPGPTAAAFFDHYTHSWEPGLNKVINGEFVTPNQNRTIRRWRSGGSDANPKAVRRLLWDLGFSQDWFDRWVAEHKKT